MRAAGPNNSATMRDVSAGLTGGVGTATAFATTGPIIGQDTLDWPGIITASLDGGGAEWFMVEQEQIPEGMTPLSSSKASLLGLQKVLTGMKR